MLNRHAKGFTLVELMIAVAITGILLAIAVPSFRDFIKRMSVKTAAESALNGLRRAQAEAIGRNARVDFRLVSAKASLGAVANVNGPNWVVRTTTPEYVTGYNLSESGTGMTVKGKYNAVRFTGLGRAIRTTGAVLPAPYWVVYTDPDISFSRCVYVTPGGAVKMCDPNATSGAAACTPTLASTDCK